MENKFSFVIPHACAPWLLISQHADVYGSSCIPQTTILTILTF